MRVFDAFTVFNELDLLELRLNILDPHVDKFILVESRQTFMGDEKLLYYEENKERFAKWNDKIIHIVAPNIEIQSVPFERHWFCYELIEKELQKHDPEDIAYCSDLDEIWSPIIGLDDEIHSLGQLNYSYYLNMRSSEDWVGTLVSKIKNIEVGYNKEYRSVKPNIIPNAGWHFTNQGGVEQIKKKVAAYDHGHEIPQAWFQANIETFMNNGNDFLGRPNDYTGKPYQFTLDESGWPEYLKENREQYKHMIKDEENTG